MATTMNDKHHFLRFGLVSVFLIAVLAILGMVALVTGDIPTSLPKLAHGAVMVDAQPGGANLAGSASARRASGTMPATHRYLGCDEKTGGLLFQDLAHGSLVRVPLTQAGMGALGFTNGPHVVKADDGACGARIAIDLDGDQQYDRKVVVGGYFALS